ncbi:hypothetical protein BUALT_BualtUnG0002100 [Buddleja alternifolia]|uniref:S1 motif domain-containing protein n=1 Tax=Buddleja alternifolia TaxID=168488 RepID=A0AAV6W1C2_9LAMI|nr:hypothetical protein BUALT_BualtUnG0002100 [Buddleja alternifolia]
MEILNVVEEEKEKDLPWPNPNVPTEAWQKYSEPYMRALVVKGKDQGHESQGHTDKADHGPSVQQSSESTYGPWMMAPSRQRRQLRALGYGDGIQKQQASDHVIFTVTNRNKQGKEENNQGRHLGKNLNQRNSNSKAGNTAKSKESNGGSRFTVLINEDEVGVGAKRIQNKGKAKLGSSSGAKYKAKTNAFNKNIEGTEEENSHASLRKDLVSFPVVDRGPDGSHNMEENPQTLEGSLRGQKSNQGTHSEGWDYGTDIQECSDSDAEMTVDTVYDNLEDFISPRDGPMFHYALEMESFEELSDTPSSKMPENVESEELELHNKPSPNQANNGSVTEIEEIEQKKPNKDEVLEPFYKFFRPFEEENDSQGNVNQTSIGEEREKVSVEYYELKLGDLVVGVVVSGNDNKLDVNVGADLLGTMLTKEVLPLYDKEMDYLLCDLEKDAEEFLVRWEL